MRLQFLIVEHIYCGGEISFISNGRDHLLYVNCQLICLYVHGFPEANMYHIWKKLFCIWYREWSMDIYMDVSTCERNLLHYKILLCQNLPEAGKEIWLAGGKKDGQHLCLPRGDKDRFWNLLMFYLLWLKHPFFKISINRIFRGEARKNTKTVK